MNIRSIIFLRCIWFNIFKKLTVKGVISMDRGGKYLSIDITHDLIETRGEKLPPET
jgi:hypothetical protein